MNPYRNLANAYRKGRNIGMKEMRVGLGKTFEPWAPYDRLSSEVIDSLPLDKKESEKVDHDELRQKITTIVEGERKLRQMPKQNLAVRLAKLSAHQADRRRVKHPKFKSK